MSFKVLVPQDITSGGKEYLQERGYEVVIGSASDEDTICKEVEDCDALLVRTARYSRRIMESGKKLKVISRFGAGIDNIDIESATELGIQVTNAPIANSNSVAEHAISLLLGCAKNLVFQDFQTRKGNWESRNITQSIEVQGKILGLIGLGYIGRSVARKASNGLGMEVIGYDAYASRDQIPDNIDVRETVEEVFREADFISLHVPSTPETRNLVSKKNISLMKNTAILINCARGDVLNEKDLYEALVDGTIRGAGLDVFQEEPASSGNKLFELENVLVSPHNAALTYEAMDRMGIHAAMGIIGVLEGREPAWKVNNL